MVEQQRTQRQADRVPQASRARRAWPVLGLCAFCSGLVWRWALAPTDTASFSPAAPFVQLAQGTTFGGDVGSRYSHTSSPSATLTQPPTRTPTPTTTATPTPTKSASPRPSTSPSVSTSLSQTPVASASAHGASVVPVASASALGPTTSGSSTTTTSSSEPVPHQAPQSGVRYVSGDSPIVLAGETFHVVPPDLVLCIPTVLAFTPARATSRETLESVVQELEVDLITFSDFPPAPRTGQWDGQWHEQMETDRASQNLGDLLVNVQQTTAPSTLDYACRVDPDDEEAWVHADDLPPAPYQQSSASPQAARAENEANLRELFKKDRERVERAKPFLSIPRSCSVHSRRLAPRVGVVRKQLKIVCDLVADRSSYVYVLRIRSPAGTLVTNALTATQEDTGACGVSHRRHAGLVARPAEVARAGGLVDVCSPLLHINAAPLSVHFGLHDPSLPGSRFPLHGSSQEDTIDAIAGVPKQLQVRALDAVASALPFATDHATFFARLVSADRIVNAHVARAANTSRALYELRFDAREPGVYSLEVYLGWVYGDLVESSGEERDELPVPILVGPHMGHRWMSCNAGRALVLGAPFVVNVRPNPRQPPQIWGHSKCTSGDHAGRWVHLKFPSSCEPPRCNGSAAALELTARGFGRSGSWVWAPYDCYYQLYDAQSAIKCLRQQRLEWLHVNGDSQVREFIGFLLTVAEDSGGLGKFHWFDAQLLGSRVTFQFFAQAFLGHSGGSHSFREGWEPYLRHTNVPARCPTCGQRLSWYSPDLAALERFHSPSNEEQAPPDAWVWNAGMAYAASELTESELGAWLRDAASFLAAQPGPTPPAVRKAVWYSALSVFSQAHPGNDFFTTSRAQRYELAARAMAARAGMAIVDGWQVTQSRIEDSGDGVHYMRTSNVRASRPGVSPMVQQIVANVLFGECVG